MGGFGSGSWQRWNKKSTVEQSLVLAVGEIKNQIIAGASGTFTWAWSSGRQSSIGYNVTYDDSGPIVMLKYRWRDREYVNCPLPLEFTPTNFNGQQLWFCCPLIRGNAACYRRVRKLYLPPRGKYFGCRKCHNLTYRSSQKAHQYERMMGSMERFLNSR